MFMEYNIGAFIDEPWDVGFEIRLKHAKTTYRWVSCTMPEIRSAVYSWDTLFWAVKRVERSNLQQEPFFITFQDSLPLSGPFGGPRFAMGFAWVATFKWRPWGLGSKIYLPPFLCGELIDFQNVPSIILEEDKSFLGWIEDIWRQNAAKNWVGGRFQMSSCFARHFERELRLCGWLVFTSWVYGVRGRHTRTVGHRFPHQKTQ
jgi:hypothetical protein